MPDVPSCVVELGSLRVARSRSLPAPGGTRGTYWGCPSWLRLHLVDPPVLDKAVSSMIAHTRRRDQRQSAVSNRFTGSARLERAFQQCTTQLQLREVQRRLWLCSAVLLFETLFLFFAPEHRFTTVALKSVHGLLPCVLTLVAGAALSSSWLSRYWRPIVMGTAVVTFNLIVFTMLPIATNVVPDVPADLEEVALFQLGWLLIYQMVVALNSALDFSLVALTCLALYASFALLLAVECGLLGEDAAPIKGIDVQCARDPTSKILLLATFGGVLLLSGARRINRFERLGFARSYFQQLRLEEHAGALAGERIELLAIFANPTLSKRQQAEFGLHPLRLGQELKFLLRAVPRVHLELEPAATFDDARTAVLRHNPRTVMFSGHTLAQRLGISTLAFEMHNSRVDLQSSPEHFVAMLAEACAAPGSKLECVFLNACLTSPLAFAVMRALPHLHVICWSSITEDSAARYLSAGFADAIGEDLREGAVGGPPELRLRRAFARGCDAFLSVGCRFGDPVSAARHRGFPPRCRCRCIHLLTCPPSARPSRRSARAVALACAQQPFLDAGEKVPPVQGDAMLLTSSATPGEVLAWRPDGASHELVSTVIVDGSNVGEGGCEAVGAGKDAPNRYPHALHLKVASPARSPTV